MVEAESTTRREYAPRNALEYADKLIQAKYSESHPLLNIDLILANLDSREREVAMAFLMAAMKLKQLKEEVEKQTGQEIDWKIVEDYELAFCYLIDSSRALNARTLDAATIQRIEQKSRYKEEIDKKDPWYRRI